MKYLLSVLFLILCSCGFEEEVDLHVDKEKFISEWNAWKSQDIKNYSFTLKEEWQVGDAYEVAIIVKNGIMDSFEYIGKAPDFKPGYTSISDMYQKIYDEIKYYENKKESRCISSVRYEMEYHQEFHYITNFEARYGARSCIGMNGVEITVSDFSEN